MTKEVAEKIVRGIEDKIECNTVDIDDWAEFWGFTREEYEDFLDMAIKALDKQPYENCEDCISREEVLRHRHVVQNNDWIGRCVVRVDEITKLPSVTPQQRVGRWILEEVKDEDGRPYDIKYFCSECQAERPPIWDDYCGACGAKMEVEE